MSDVDCFFFFSPSPPPPILRDFLSKRDKDKKRNFLRAPADSPKKKKKNIKFVCVQLIKYKKKKKMEEKIFPSLFYINFVEMYTRTNHLPPRHLYKTLFYRLLIIGKYCRETD